MKRKTLCGLGFGPYSRIVVVAIVLSCIMCFASVGAASTTVDTESAVQHEKGKLRTEIFPVSWPLKLSQETILYGCPDSAGGVVKAVVEKGWIRISRELPSGELLWKVVLAKYTPGMLPVVTFFSRDDGSKYPSYAMISYKAGYYYIKDDGRYLRIRRQAKEENAGWLTKPISDTWEKVGAAGYGETDMVCWKQSSGFVVGTGGPGVLSDCILNIVTADPNEGFDLMRASKTGMRSFHHRDAFLYDDGEIIIAKFSRKPPADSSSTLVLVGMERPEFSFSNVLPPHAKSIEETILEAKALLVCFWATWCQPCVQKLPIIQEIHDQYSNSGLVVLAVHASSVTAVLSDFVKSNDILYPVAVATSKMEVDFEIKAWPTYLLISADNKIAYLGKGRLPTLNQIDECLSLSFPKRSRIGKPKGKSTKNQ